MSINLQINIRILIRLGSPVVSVPHATSNLGYWLNLKLVCIWEDFSKSEDNADLNMLLARERYGSFKDDRRIE
jgi:hypothetical protein